ncbi:glycerol-1-phosphate dehydrogenase [NAD(P)+] [Clostridia bacterium]|nr:glycerol-1-phosphate dehydrogenase [NAD(P)+] [Clostridia bacterium]
MNFSLEKYLGTCKCGKNHSLITTETTIRSKAADDLPEVAKKLGLSSGACVICDENTLAFAERASERIQDLLHSIKPITVLNPAGLHADEVSVERVLTQLPADSKWLLAAGSGTIHDITRYVAHKRGIPFVSFPTAASVDGFVSDGCAMTWYGFKKTIPATAPVAVVADTDIFANAPYRLTASGVGDVLGKYISLADWQIANIISDEGFCPEIAAISRKAVNHVRDNLDAIYRREPDAMEKLMYAQLLSGIAMQMWGTSRPASGIEHLFSHLWEMEVINTHLDALHGEKVGVGLNIALPLYKRMAARPDFGKGFKKYEGLPHELLKSKYGKLYQAVVDENTPDSAYGVSHEKFTARIDDIRDIIAGLPDEKALREDLDRAKVLTSLSQIGLDDSYIEDTIALAPFIRNRVTLLRASREML